MKAWGLRLQRLVRDRSESLPRWDQETTSKTDWFRACESRTALWLEQDPREQILERGKVEYLHRACARLDRVAIEAGGVFSFWRQMGRAGKRQGFVEGRMLQQGCLVPAVGGGLCQLSNALYELALLHRCEILERHAHSGRLPHMPLHDATVAWNYIDLRFRVCERLRIRAGLTEAELVVAFESQQPRAFGILSAPQRVRSEPMAEPQAKSCASCGEAGCFRHRARLD